MMNGLDNWWFIGLGMMLLFWITVIVLVIWAVRSLFPRQRREKHDQSLYPLRQRYAAGEIDAAEFEREHAQGEETPVA